IEDPRLYFPHGLHKTHLCAASTGQVSEEMFTRIPCIESLLALVQRVPYVRRYRKRFIYILDEIATSKRKWKVNSSSAQVDDANDVVAKDVAGEKLTAVDAKDVVEDVVNEAQEEKFEEETSIIKSSKDTGYGLESIVTHDREKPMAKRDPVKNMVENQEGDTVKNVVENQEGDAVMCG
ncbi:hypothetical protein Tco_1281048, partial [Tanacetum coccineum]